MLRGTKVRFRIDVYAKPWISKYEPKLVLGFCYAAPEKDVETGRAGFHSVNCLPVVQAAAAGPDDL